MNAQRPTVHLDTNAISAMYYAGGDSVALARRLATSEWWEHERSLFGVLTAALTEPELAFAERACELIRFSITEGGRGLTDER